MFKIIVVVSFIAIILAFLFLWMWRNYNRYTKIEKESFKNPDKLSLIKSGRILKTVGISDGKIQLSIMELDVSLHCNGSLKIEELISIYNIDRWFFLENIPEEFQKLNTIFVMENDDGELKFSVYKGILIKKTEIFTINHKRKTNVIELKTA